MYPWSLAAGATHNLAGCCPLGWSASHCKSSVQLRSTSDHLYWFCMLLPAAYSTAGTSAPASGPFCDILCYCTHCASSVCHLCYLRISWHYHMAQVEREHGPLFCVSFCHL